MKYMKCVLVVLLIYVGGVEAGCSWYDGPCQAREAADKAYREAQEAARWAQEQKDNLAREAKRLADEAKKVADAIAKAAADLAAKVGCVAKVGATVTVDVAKNLAGKSVSFEEISVEGTLGGATFTVKARGKIMQKSFNLSSSIGKDGFSQDGFKKLLYDPLAKLF